MTNAERALALSTRWGLPDLVGRLAAAEVAVGAAKEALRAAVDAARDLEAQAADIRRRAVWEAAAAMPSPTWVLDAATRVVGSAAAFKGCRVRLREYRARPFVQIIGESGSQFGVWADTGVPHGKRTPAAAPELVRQLVLDYEAWERREG